MKYGREIEMKIQLMEGNKPKGKLEIKNLRIAFSIVKTNSWCTNTAIVRVWNLSKDKRNELAHYGDEIKLYAGYKEETGAQLLFIGDVTRLLHSFNDPEIISIFTCGDGDKIINNKVITLAFSNEVSAKTIIENIATQIDMKIVTPIVDKNKKYYNGSFGTNHARDHLIDVCKMAGLTWSVQNGNLVILPTGEGSERPPHEINSETGLIGTPERTSDRRGETNSIGLKQAWKFRTLLRPDIIPGDRVHLKSSRAPVDGVFVVISINHDGDNYGPQFESFFEVVGI